ncbi:helix-turn-helix domain-containing protein [Lactococcus raffinolactis]|uniref:helix-turn-helix domain-containing protein n=1 Tax=Pseudolactococcus raffinolactis TaxID=1366 RepID=UPI001109E830|nr:helix-turn-helix transcriptional regulator [Lactococcus raffinolactis]TLQ15446.1 helix-turn-helix domain-containing protein [Lactococcus raffinolactis]
MTTFEQIKKLSDERKISLKDLANKLGFGENYFYNMKNAKSSPSSEVLLKVADYFHVSVDYLLGREEQTAPQFSTELLDAIDNAEGYSGKPIDDHDKEIVKSLLAAYFAGRDK